MRPLQSPARRARAGMTFIEVMVAAAIMFTGAVVMISVLPRLIAAGSSRTSRDGSYIYAMSKMDDILTSPYSTVASSASGDFSTLLPAASDVSSYTWSYTSTEPLVEGRTGLLKRVTLLITWGSGSDQTDTYVFYMADKNDD